MVLILLIHLLLYSAGEVREGRLCKHYFFKQPGNIFSWCKPTACSATATIIFVTICYLFTYYASIMCFMYSLISMFMYLYESAHAFQFFFVVVSLAWISTILGWSWCWALGTFLMGENEVHFHAVWSCFLIRFLISLHMSWQPEFYGRYLKNWRWVS